MRSFLIIVFFLLFNSNTYAQNNYVIGKTIDSITNHAINNATITVYTQKKVMGNFLADNKGVFKIPFSIYHLSTHIEIQATNYQLFIHKIQSEVSPQHSNLDLKEIKLIPKGILLNEVVIKRNKRYRDTTNIDLSNEKFERQIMIDDILSKQKGFYKDSQGQLYYKGKIVSDILLNNGDFFGKNNLDIYKHLPALTLSNIQITETNIDSLTNTTTLSPMIKVNLQLKDKYKSGKFGIVNAGGGTLKRYVINTDLYAYRNKEQVSFQLNSNNINIGDNAFSEPNVVFSPNGNNSTISSSKITYKKVISKKIELYTSLKGKIDNRNFLSEIDRRDENINQSSTTLNSSRNKIFSLEDADFNLTYKIDSLNLLKLDQVMEYNHSKQKDTLAYTISSDHLATMSQVDKTRNTSLMALAEHILYRRLFTQKKGRILNFGIDFAYHKYKNKEINDVDDTSNETSKRYFIDGNRAADETGLTISSDFTEPLTEASYLKFLFTYKNEKLDYSADILSDTVKRLIDDPAQFTNQYFKQGIQFQQSFSKLSLNGVLTGILNLRKVESNNFNRQTTLFNLDASFSADYKMTGGRNLSGQYSRLTNYPNVNQLTNINNSFGLITQMESNPRLEPEVKNSLQMTYDLKKTDSINLSISGGLELYSSKFGFHINTSPAQEQYTFIDNLGDAISSNVAFTLSNNYTNGNNLNYHAALNYQQIPTLIDGEKMKNRGVSISQSISTSKALFKRFLSVAPTLSTSFSRYYYSENKSDLFNLTYTDRISVDIAKFQIALYPLMNYSASISNNFTFAMNGEIKKSFLKTYGTLWLKMYDIFNSFKYANNTIGDSYVQTTRFSNVQRYLLLGISLKFNNMK